MNQSRGLLIIFSLFLLRITNKFVSICNRINKPSVIMAKQIRKKSGTGLRRLSRLAGVSFGVIQKL